VERAEGAWDSAAEQGWLDRLRRDHANIDLALQWALDEQRAEEALRLTAGLFAFWIYTLPPALYRASLVRALALPWAAGSGSARRARARALNVAGYAAVLDGHCAHALDLFDEGLRLYRQLGDTSAVAWALRGRGFARRMGGDPDAADDLESLALCRAVGDGAGIAWSVHDLGEVAFLQGELDEAERLLEEGLLRLEDEGVEFGAYRAVVLLGGVHVRRAQWHRALSRYEVALVQQRRTHFVARGAEIMDGLAVTAAALHRPTLAARLLGAAAAWRRAYGFLRDVYDVGAESTARAVRRQLGAAAWSAHHEAGYQLTPEQVMDEAERSCQELASTAAGREIRLTGRQLEVLAALAQGLSNAEIAARLVLSTRTVHAHVRSIFDKLEVGSRTAAVHRAAELDLV
jgi:non-specific serine/threonine protein kinase